MFIASWREFGPVLENAVSLTTLSLYREKGYGLILEEKDKAKCIF